MLHLSSVYHTGPVTALCCHGNSVLAGIGSQIHVYSIPQCELVQSTEVLPARVIHGIKQVFETDQSTKFCVYGQKCLRLVELDSTSQLIAPVGHLIEFSDWLLDVTWLQGDEHTRQLCLALGHNVISIYDTDKQAVVKNIHCQEKCILYCAKFLTSQTDCVILAAGTVFNQVVIWSAQSVVNSTERVEPFHRLTGHQGVIFSVDYSPKLKLICSVSDDRSIRLYTTVFQQNTSDPTLVDWEKMDTTLLHVLYGHSARVWDVKLLSKSFVSVGEDSTCCVWSYDGKVLKKFKGHKGKSIWSMCVDKGENCVITGGGDNSVRLWQLQQDESDSKTSQTRSLSLKLDKVDFPRNAMLLDTERILAITNMGKLMMYNQTTDQCTCLMSDEMFGSYTVMAVSSGGGCIAVGNIHGTARILYESETSSPERPEFLQTDVKVCEGKLLSVVWLGEDKLVTTAPEGIINIWEITIKTTSPDIKLTFTFVLPPSKHRWVSAAALTVDGGAIVIGNRTGSLFLYRLDDASKTGELVQTFPKIHGKAGVTFVCCHDNQVFSAGRDGIYRTFVWNEAGQLDLLHDNRVCKGFEWIERLEFTEYGDIQIQGFYSNFFVIWSVRQNQKLMEIECGGGHRAWDYRCHGNSATFVHVKTREVKVTNVKMRSNQVIVKKCLHGRELCDAKHICSGIDNSGNSVTAIVTCSEDTSLCLSFLQCRKRLSELDVRHSLSGHISTVRCLYVCSSSQTQTHAADNVNPSSHRKLIFSGGGRAQLKVWCIEVLLQDTGQTQCTNRNRDDAHGQNSQVATGYRLGAFDQKSLPTADDISKTSVSGLNEQQWNLENIDSVQNSESVQNTDSVQNSKSVQDHIHLGNESSDRCNFLGGSNVRPLSSCGKNIDKSVGKHTLNYVCLAGMQLSNINRKCKKPWRQPVDNSDPETRILDLSVVTPEELGHMGSRSLYFISAACSDGFLRLLSFDEMTREISIIAATSYHDHCVLKTSHVVLPIYHGTGSCDSDHVTQRNQWPFRILILSAATDGKVALWDVTDICKEVLLPADSTTSEEKQKPSRHDVKPWTEKPVCVFQVHQSGINGVYFGKYVDDTYVLITGGDDNAVHVNIVTMETDDNGVKATVVAKGSNLTAHAAQITGVWYIAPDYVVTASIDQRICVWKMEREGSCIQLRLYGCEFSSVSDIANMDVWNEGDHHRLLISGNGLEVFKLDTSETSTDHAKTNVMTKLVL